MKRESPTRSKYAILMAVSGGLEMVRLSTLKTLRHSFGKDARLMVVDNASTDGTERWLQMLAVRGDIHLIRLEQNIGHGPALEKARAASDSEFIVTLDSDAFPLSDDWLDQLEWRLKDGAEAAGIGHHRNYVHPACLMIRRGTMDRLGTRFLNEKNKPSRYDVGERLSHEIVASGGKLSFLRKTASQCRGSLSEPVDLGCEYESAIFHQWYTTRHLRAGSGRVDDVARQTFDHALAETIRRFDCEPRELTVIMGLRAMPEQPERMRNARIALESLNQQSLARWRYRIVVVEQDSQPRLKPALEPLADRWIFATNAGPYNRAWGFNTGATNPEPASGVFCLIDSDLLLTHTFLESGLRAVSGGGKVVLPFSEARFLTAAATESVLREHPRNAPGAARANSLEGRVFKNCNGLAMFIDSVTFFEAGGLDERFEGWGGEDREFWARLSKRHGIEKLPGTVLHLHHERPDESGPDAQRNQALLARAKRGRARIPSQPIGRLDKYAPTAEAPALPVPLSFGSDIPQELSSWSTWPEAKIERIVRNEMRLGGGTRTLDAKLLERFGPRVLDVGCGPGAIYARLHARKAAVSWSGVDLTPQMLTVARKLFPSIPLINANACRLPFRDRQFDAVLLRHVLEHLREEMMQETTREILRVTSKLAVIDFYIKPSESDGWSTHFASDNYLELRWGSGRILNTIQASGAKLLRRHSCSLDSELWVVAPVGSEVTTSEVDKALKSSLKVSIVMPTFRRSHVLQRTVDTVLKQTYQDWELIIVDNAGDLRTQFTDPRIRIVRHSEKASSSYARNCGLQHAAGDLVCFFDDDDIMFPNYLEAFVSAFQANPRVKMVRCGMLVTRQRINYSYATPECCVRREFLTSDWDNHGPCQDQRYFKRIVARNRWSERRGDIAVIRQPLCRACQDPNGGLRSGTY